MQMRPTRPTPIPSRLTPLLLTVSAALALGMSCPAPDLPRSGAQLYLSPQVNPMALSEDGSRLYVANTTSGTLSVLDVSNPLAPSELARVKVGHDPTSVAVLPGGAGGDELVYVVNHISDSISVVSRNQLAVVQTIQGLDAHGVTTTNEPVAIAFASPSRAFVTLDEPNQVLVLDVDANGRATLRDERLPITAQAPRALAVANGRLYVASFESGNQTEFPTCWPGDERGLDPTSDWDEGCEFTAEIIEGLDITCVLNPDPNDPDCNFLIPGAVFDFAAVNPNIGGRVIRDRDLPDRDLFVFDAETLLLEQVIEGVGTMLNGLVALPAGAGARVVVANTEARNQLDGLAAIDNRMFENRVSVLECGAACGAPVHVNLDASAAGLGQTVPNPWGIAASGDGQTLVVTAAAADGDPGDGRPPLHGLFTLDAHGNVRGSALVGALPEGVVVRSDAEGRARVAYVLDTADSTVSVVDLSDPDEPVTVGAAVAVGSDPTPEQIRVGRVAFHSARASTTGTFSCGSCHPNGNMDQLIWTINTVQGPDDGPDDAGELAEPRTTMPIRGLRDTLPLHWEGVLGDPDPLENPLAPFDTAPDCGPLEGGPQSEVELECVRHLVDAALSGVMCQQNGAGCPTGPSGLAGALTDAERDAMAAFQLAVPYPPAPARRPTDTLSTLANQGVSDFFTNEDGLGINDGIGQSVNFAPTTCADNPMGCHSLPLTASTNSNIVGGFDAPSARGMWDRVPLFSNGIFSSEEVLRATQDCADGIEPPVKTFLFGNLSIILEGDPCNLRVPGNVLPLAELPFPSGETIYDPAVGMTERGNFIATFEGLFALVYGVRGDAIWQYQVEISNGLPGLTGRQVSVTPENAFDADTVAAMELLERAAREGRVTAVATGARVGELRFDPATGQWVMVAPAPPVPGGIRVAGVGSARGGAPPGVGPRSQTGAELRRFAARHRVVLTLTADLPANVSIGGADRQPLLDIDPDVRVVEVIGQQPSLPRPFEHSVATFRLGAEYVDPAARVLVNGELCEACSIVPAVAPETGRNALDLTLDPGLPAGVHVLQVLNPNGWASNEMPICVTDDVDVCLPQVIEDVDPIGDIAG